MQPAGRIANEAGEPQLSRQPEDEGAKAGSLNRAGEQDAESNVHERSRTAPSYRAKPASLPPRVSARRPAACHEGLARNTLALARHSARHVEAAGQEDQIASGFEARRSFAARVLRERCVCGSS